MARSVVLCARWTQPLNCHIGHESVGERNLLLHWGFGCLWGLEWCWLCDAQVWESSWWHRSPEVWMSWKESSVTWALVISYDSEKWKVMCVVDSALGPKAGNISCLHLAPTSLGVTFVLFFFLLLWFFSLFYCVTWNVSLLIRTGFYFLYYALTEDSLKHLLPKAGVLLLLPTALPLVLWDCSHNFGLGTLFSL